MNSVTTSFPISASILVGRSQTLDGAGTHRRETRVRPSGPLSPCYRRVRGILWEEDRRSAPCSGHAAGLDRVATTRRIHVQRAYGGEQLWNQTRSGNGPRPPTLGVGRSRRIGSRESKALGWTSSANVRIRRVGSPSRSHATSA